MIVAWFSKIFPIYKNIGKNQGQKNVMISKTKKICFDSNESMYNNYKRKGKKVHAFNFRFHQETQC